MRDLQKRYWCEQVPVPAKPADFETLVKQEAARIVAREAFGDLFRLMASKGGKAKSARKAQAARVNGRLGGRGHTREKRLAMLEEAGIPAVAWCSGVGGTHWAEWKKALEVPGRMYCLTPSERHVMQLIFGLNGYEPQGFEEAAKTLRRKKASIMSAMRRAMVRIQRREGARARNA